MSEAEFKKCTDCKFYGSRGDEDHRACTHEKALVERHYHTGELVNRYRVVSDMRAEVISGVSVFTGMCGPEAKLFEPIEPITATVTFDPEPKEEAEAA